MSIIDPELTGRDWGAIRARLAHHGDVASREGVETAESERALLESRARTLARRAEDAQDVATLEILRITLDTHAYAVGTLGIVAVVQQAEIISIPGATGAVAYLASWRGRLLSVLDLRPTFGLSAPPAQSLLVIGRAGSEVGLLVDAIDEIHLIRESEVQELASGGASHDGMVRGALADATPLLSVSGIVAQYPADG